MPVICFLDASTIADWLILKLALEEIKNKENKSELLSRREKDNPQLYYAYNLLQKIKIDNTKKFYFITSNLSIVEVISVIHDKICVDNMYEQGVPLKYWYKYRDDFSLNEEELKRLMEEMTSFIDEFVILGKINLVDGGIKKIFDIIVKHKETHDSFLISQAVESQANYFISRDKRLKNNLKDYKEITILNPRHFYNNIYKD